MVAATLVTLGVALAAPGAYPFAGINAGAPIWGGTILLDGAKAADIGATGCGTVRVNFRIDGNSSWNSTLLTKYDAIIQNCTSRNLQVLGLFCNELLPLGQTYWNDDPDGDGLNSYVTTFSTTALTLVDRYKAQIKCFEIWNEPDCWSNPNYANDPQNAGGTYILPRVYAKLLAETYMQCEVYNNRRILSTNGISLSTGGVFAHDIGGSNPNGYFSYVYWGDVYARTALWDWMQANAGRRYPWDYFGYHFYLSQGTSFSSSQLAQYLNRMVSRKTANNDNTPFLITEFSWNSLAVSESLQAANLRNCYNYLKTRTDVFRAYWYQWQDEQAGSWGIVRADGSQKPAYAEFVAQQTQPPPIAQFSASPTAGTRPLVVQFTDESTGGPVTSRSWAFGDGGTSTAANPAHTYVAAGAYTVTLTATGPGGSDSETKVAYVQVSAPPPPGDFDGDDDVDLTDFSLFQLCFNGPNRAPSALCTVNADFDGDGDVDLIDFGTFQACFNGPNRTPACPV